MLRLKLGITELHYLIILIFAVLVFIAGARGEVQEDASDTLISLGTRVFDLRERSPILNLQVENEFVSLTDVGWIKDMTWSDPLLARTVIHIKDRSHGLGVPGWLPDDRSRFHPDASLPPIFDLDGYEVGWAGIFYEFRPRGDILIFPKLDSQSFYVNCAYDRADPAPTFCAVNFRYGPDRNLFIKTRIYQVTSPLNDFDEIVARLDALVTCLDVTEAVRAGENNPSAASVLQKDIAAGGRCRILPSG